MAEQEKSGTSGRGNKTDDGQDGNRANHPWNAVLVSLRGVFFGAGDVVKLHDVECRRVNPRLCGTSCTLPARSNTETHATFDWSNCVGRAGTGMSRDERGDPVRAKPLLALWFVGQLPYPDEHQGRFDPSPPQQTLGKETSLRKSTIYTGWAVQDRHRFLAISPARKRQRAKNEPRAGGCSLPSRSRPTAAGPASEETRPRPLTDV